MTSLFSQVLNMSLTGSVVILFVMLVRFLLKNSPKIFSYSLWAVVLFRLLCPVALSAPVSVLEVFQPQVTEASQSTSVVTYLPAAAPQSAEITFVPAENLSASQSEETPDKEMKQERFDFLAAATGIWIAGMTIMLLYSAVQYILLRRRLVGAMAYRGNVYLSDYIDSPFVMGFLSPKIYLPSTVPMKERKFIIAHERHHIRRFDHVIKLLAYAALCIHWFNPLVWAAFLQAGKDMEMSCDEAVIRKLGPQIRADYSASLLRLATHRKIIAGMPLAFGEGDTKGRVMNMSKWKKPKLWASIICLLLCAAVLVACAVNPAPQEESSYMPTVEPEEKAAGGEITRIPFTVGQLPAGYAYEIDERGDILFTDGTNTVGGITAYPIPEGIYDPYDDIFLWLEDVGIPDFEDTSLCYMGGITAPKGGWIAEFASDVPEGVEPTVDRRHHFYPIGDRVYDIWFDMLLIDYSTSEDLRCAVEIPATVGQKVREPADTAGEAAFEKCRAVMEAVESGSYYIRSDLKSVGDLCDVSDKASQYLYHEDDEWLNIFDIDPRGLNLSDEGDYTARVAYMYADGTFYSNEGSAGAAYTDIDWQVDEYPDDPASPWLASFLLVEANATYMDTLTDESGECVMFRVDKKYADKEEYADCYFANFYFDPEGNFLSVRLQVNAFLENEFTVTESIVSLDPDTVAAEIDKEYRRTLG